MSSVSKLCDRGLIVEDIRATLDGLTLELQDAFPAVTIDSARSVAEAFKFIGMVRSSAGFYDFAVIDVRLPEAHGHNEESDFSIEAEIKKYWSDAIIIRISSHADEADVQPKTQRIEHFIPKIGDYPLEVINQLRSLLHERRIQRKFDALASGREETVGRARIGEGGRSDREKALYIADLCADASQHWDDLRPSLRESLKQAFGYAVIQKGGRTLHVLGVAGGSIPGSTKDSIEPLT